MSESKFRALCAELLDELQYQTSDGTAAELKARARAALATPNAQYQLCGVEWEDEEDDGTTPGWKQLARQGR